MTAVSKRTHQSRMARVEETLCRRVYARPSYARLATQHLQRACLARVGGRTYWAAWQSLQSGAWATPEGGIAR